MSYCRFSSDNFKSDVYVYEDCMGGWTTHVAKGRIVGDAPSVPPIGTVKPEDWLAAHQAQMDWLDRCEHVTIDLPHAGESFNHDDIEDCIAFLEDLRSLGYHIPQHALDALREEMAEELAADGYQEQAGV